MASHRWCTVCRGDDKEDLFKCGGCPHRFHIECVGLQARPDKSWRCEDCQNPVQLSEEEQERRDAFAASQKRVAEASRKQAARKRLLIMQQHISYV